MADPEQEEGALEPDPPKSVVMQENDDEPTSSGDSDTASSSENHHQPCERHSDNQDYEIKPLSSSINITQEFRADSLQWKPSQQADLNRISFLDLALELRNQIYKEALVKERIEKIPYTKVPRLAPKFYPGPADDPVNFALFAVCRQIRAEAQTVFYSENTFVANEMMITGLIKGKLDDRGISLSRILEVVPKPYSSLVRRLEIKLFWSCVFNGSIASAIQGAIEVIRNASPRVKQVDFELVCYSPDAKMPWNCLGLPKCSKEEAVKLLEDGFSSEPFPDWFHSTISVFLPGSEWNMLSKVLKK
ncbi:hypothetical protein BU16DRAFT_326421 [Lophium mytilinum]|uniref:Uncharacterized protein n=1 Tax=Lophium mytilinum TaxID=390894 RepID=A0A6A6R0R9_9PEZI|nr:hypothetical protein BU16DRAFT_326421 [Lophium mytilinum]